MAVQSPGEESISSKVSSTRPDTDPVLAAGPFLGVRWRSRVLEGRVENSLDPIVRLRDALLPMELPVDENLVLRHLRVEVPPLIWVELQTHGVLPARHIPEEVLWHGVLHAHRVGVANGQRHLAHRAFHGRHRSPEVEDGVAGHVIGGHPAQPAGVPLLLAQAFGALLRRDDGVGHVLSVQPIVLVHAEGVVVRATRPPTQHEAGILDIDGRREEVPDQRINLLGVHLHDRGRRLQDRVELLRAGLVRSRGRGIHQPVLRRHGRAMLQENEAVLFEEGALRQALLLLQDPRVVHHHLLGRGHAAHVLERLAHIAGTTQPLETA
mmetsp:Transcript_34013/g.108155  ORF Transcript_34013/g.108155 Transcript_34013/m.108155 type:complete len:323 (-) Transcript_34013:200-1168(-)